MEILLLVVGKTGIGYVKEGITEYCNRLKRYVPFSILEIPDIKGSKGLSQAQQKEKEGIEILSKLTPADNVVLLDEHGKLYTSIEFSNVLQRLMATGRKRIVFVVGGPYGFSEAVKNRADSLLSLSKMTFNHEMVRLFFTEQIYRAMTILRGEPYHHE
ncbi:MAG: 23S rRNA (pseudouridine(1915)-N(3))-methyltransferase RlmH [Muribaculaceae bacterium]|nr:23S rRNA (pseudouridine(1915)-N(3))-methyltransferase RlmH [Muribaculaceae bacterium]